MSEKCPQCGAPRSPEDTVCKYCGEKLSPVQANQPQQAAVNQQTSQGQPVIIVNNNGASQPKYKPVQAIHISNTYVNKDKKKKGWIVVLAIIVVIGIIGAIAGL